MTGQEIVTQMEEQARGIRESGAAPYFTNVFEKAVGSFTSRRAGKGFYHYAELVGEEVWVRFDTGKPARFLPDELNAYILEAVK